MNCRTTRRNEVERQGVRNAALNAWFGHSKKVAEKHYEKVTEDDFADAIRPVGLLVGLSVGKLDATTESSNVATSKKKPPMIPTEGSVGNEKYTLEDSNL